MKPAQFFRACPKMAAAIVLAIFSATAAADTPTDTPTDTPKAYAALGGIDPTANPMPAGSAPLHFSDSLVKPVAATVTTGAAAKIEPDRAGTYQINFSCRCLPAAWDDRAGKNHLLGNVTFIVFVNGAAATKGRFMYRTQAGLLVVDGRPVEAALSLSAPLDLAAGDDVSILAAVSSGLDLSVQINDAAFSITEK